MLQIHSHYCNSGIQRPTLTTGEGSRCWLRPPNLVNRGARMGYDAVSSRHCNFKRKTTRLQPVARMRICTRNWRLAAYMHGRSILASIVPDGWSAPVASSANCFHSIPRFYDKNFTGSERLWTCVPVITSPGLSRVRQGLGQLWIVRPADASVATGISGQEMAGLCASVRYGVLIATIIQVILWLLR